MLFCPYSSYSTELKSSAVIFNFFYIYDNFYIKEMKKFPELL